MPVIDNVKTTNSAVKWQSPDGQKTIYEVTLALPDSRTFTVSTYSDAIGKVGWAGSIESYEKEGKYGTQTFVKQPQREAPQGSAPGSGYKPGQGTDSEAIARAVALKTSGDVHSGTDAPATVVTGDADVFLAWLEAKEPAQSEAQSNQDAVANIFNEDELPKL